MPLTYSFKFPLPNGLHARPASHLAELARHYSANISLQNAARGSTADMKSVLSMVAADVHLENPCTIQFSGSDEQAAHDAMTRFIVEKLPATDEALPEVATRGEEQALPQSLLAAGLGQYVRGTPVSGGVAIGNAVPVRSVSLPKVIRRTRPVDVAEEIRSLRTALRTVGNQMGARAARATAPTETELLEVHRALMSDPELVNRAESQIQTGNFNAPQAVLEAGQHLIRTLKRSTSSYLRERVLDLQDVLLQLLTALGHVEDAADKVRLSGPSICIADHLTPGQFLSMDRTKLKGLVLGEAGTTSHTVILARARGIPTLVDAKAVLTRVRPEHEIVLDAEIGIIIPSVSSTIRRYYDMEQARLDRMREKQSQSVSVAAQPAGGEPIEVGANIAGAEEVADAIAQGGDGIGLFRTEMLYIGRASAPTEDEQFAIYAKALRDAGAKPVIIRTFDIGGDKPAPYLDLPAETNPFLGNRGVRLYATQAGILLSQLRALLRASASGNLKILVPMISCVEEVRAFRAALDAARQELLGEGEDVKLPQVGVMIEVPAAAMIMPQLCAEVDFFSIGSNDLTQYLLAVDRDHPELRALYTWSHPALLKMLKNICADARAAGKWVGLCGELGDNLEALPLLIGMGLDEISLSAGRIAATKARIRSFEKDKCEALLDACTRCASRDEVLALLQSFQAGSAKRPMLSTELIHLASPSRSKEEAIKELIDELWVNERVDDPKVIEQAIWTREASYSTGFGYGCAIPHCKSTAVRSSSVAVAKLSKPVQWNQDGSNPVDLIVMLVLREQDHSKDHMRVLSQLSRLLMRDEFRDGLRKIRKPDDMLAYLNQHLAL